MRCPTLKELPRPPKGKLGWPWTQENPQLPDTMSDGKLWPKISIVTPNYNYGQFIEETIRSVLLQGYPNLEYIIIDDGSTDDSIKIIKKYERWLTYYVNESNEGQTHAINKGFRKMSGSLIAWQNSDDYYHPEAFMRAAQASFLFKDADIIYGSVGLVDRNGMFLKPYPISQFKIEDLIPCVNISNQAIFFRKKIFEENNFLDESFQYAMDQEFFFRLAKKGYRFNFAAGMIGYFRLHPNSKTYAQDDVSLKESLKIFVSIYKDGGLPSNLRDKALECVCGLCLRALVKLRFHIFCEGLKRFISIAGIWRLYALPILGAKNYLQILHLFGISIKMIKRQR